MALKINL